jgi:invasion protein IalB
MMSIRLSVFVAAALIAGATQALAQQAPAQPRNPNAPVLNESFQDWSLRCFNVRGPAPCDMLQVSVNKQTQQRVLLISLAYIPQRTAFALQIVVPLGVAISKGLTLNAGNKTLRNVRYNRCTREGCFVEAIIDSATVDALGKVGASTTVVVYPYGRTNDAKLPLSLKGFNQGIARLRVVASQRAVRTATPAPATPAAPVAPAPAPAPAPTP